MLHSANLYNIEFDANVILITDLLRQAAVGSFISKKHLPKELSRYSFIKVSEAVIYLIGEGSRPHSRNAFIGEGNYGRVKIAIQLAKNEQDQFLPTGNICLVKIMGKKRLLKPDSFDVLVQEAEREVCIFRHVYGFGDMVVDHVRSRIYLILPKLPGKTLVFYCKLEHDPKGITLEQILAANIDYRGYKLMDLQVLIVNAFLALLFLHRKGVVHGDITLKNTLYDERSRQVCYVDFGLSELMSAITERRILTYLYSDYKQFKQLVINIMLGFYQSQHGFDADLKEVSRAVESNLAILNDLFESVIDIIRSKREIKPFVAAFALIIEKTLHTIFVPVKADANSVVMGKFGKLQHKLSLFNRKRVVAETSNDKVSLNEPHSKL